ncbi:unnamed protein product [Echinostoma caproni]|uniref:Uncharacterized protein n=1 Tax=Echinostoma caproni TaxID=27848 RepID=A0A3P8BHE1_9TREM|nr:unnamed protein product [Echinostoma caproni]
MLDGFPCNLRQAELLEQRLTVNVSSASSETNLISVEDLDVKLASCRSLDLIILLDVTDDEVLTRAANRSDYNAPEVPIPDSHDNQTPKYPDEVASYGQIQERLASFLESWPSMSQFYSTKRPGIQVVRLDAGGQLDSDGFVRKISPESILKEIEQILQLFLDTRQSMSLTEPSDGDSRSSGLTNVPKDHSVDKVESQKITLGCETVEGAASDKS